MLQEPVSKHNDTDSGSQVYVEDYASPFPIFAFNASHHKETLRGGSANTEIRWSLSANCCRHYNAYALMSRYTFN